LDNFDEEIKHFLPDRDIDGIDDFDVSLQISRERLEKCLLLKNSNNLPCDLLWQVDLILSNIAPVNLVFDIFLHRGVVTFAEESEHGQVLIQLIHSHPNLEIDVLVMDWVCLYEPEELISDPFSFLELVEPYSDVFTHTIQEPILYFASNRFVNSFLDDSLTLADTEHDKITNQQAHLVIFAIFDVAGDELIIKTQFSQFSHELSWL
jgi:hypothetical protein